MSAGDLVDLGVPGELGIESVEGPNAVGMEGEAPHLLGLLAPLPHVVDVLPLFPIPLLGLEIRQRLVGGVWLSVKWNSDWSKDG